MPAYLVDSSLLLDVFTSDPVWASWSVDRLEQAWSGGTVFIDLVVYAEVSIRFFRIEELEEAIGESGLVWSEIPREALFLAGKAFLSYRKTEGHRTTPLPDFFIGAHAAVSDLVLITRDPRKDPKALPQGAHVVPRSPLNVELCSQAGVTPLERLHVLADALPGRSRPGRARNPFPSRP